MQTRRQQCPVAKLHALICLILTGCLVTYDTPNPPEALQRRSVYLNQLYVREHADGQPIHHSEESPIWMSVNISSMTPTSPYSMAACMLSGFTFTILPCYAQEDVNVRYSIQVPGTSIKEKFATRVNRGLYIWFPFIVAEPGLELDESAIWKPATRAHNTNLVEAIDRANYQIMERQNRIKALESNPDSHPVLILGAAYFEHGKAYTNNLYFSIENNSEHPIEKLVLTLGPDRKMNNESNPGANRGSGASAANSEPDSAGRETYPVAPVHFAETIQPGERTPVLEYRNHYLGVYYPQARLFKIKIHYSNGETRVMEGEEAQRLVMESPLPPAKVLYDKIQFQKLRW